MTSDLPRLTSQTMLSRGKTNFFEKRVGDYQKANVMATVNNEGAHAMSFDEDF